MTTTQITTLVQATVTQFQVRQHIAQVRKVERGYQVTTGRWGRKAVIWATYHDAKKDAVGRVIELADAEEHVADTSADGLIFEV